MRHYVYDGANAGRPKLGSPEQAAMSLEASKALGVKYVVGSASTNGTFGSAATMGVPGFPGEIGNCGLWSEAEVEAYVSGVENVLRLQKVLDGPVKENPGAVVLDHMTSLNAEQTGSWYPAVKIDEMVKKGQKLGEIRDCFTNVLGEYSAPVDGVMLYVISSLPINAGDPIAAIEKRRERP